MKELEYEDFAHLSRGDIERLVDAGFRHRNGVQPHDMLKHWLNVARCFAGGTTRDDSWGEFEKLFAIIIKRLMVAERDRKEFYDELFSAKEMLDVCARESRAVLIDGKTILEHVLTQEARAAQDWLDRHKET